MLLSEYAAAVAIFIVTEAVALVLRYQLDLISSSIIVLFGVLVSATVLGSRPSLLTAALTAIAYDYFTIPPDNSFEIRSLSDVIVLTTFPVVALLIGGLAERAHDSAKKTRGGEVAINMLSHASRKITAAWDRLDIQRRPARHVASTVRAPTIVRTSEESFIEPADAVNSPEVLPTAASRSEFEALTKTEKLRSALLSCVSHDFRTPLAVILASASSLRTLSAEMSADVREDLLAAIQEEAERLNRFVTNLLHMARLESGVVEPRRATVDIAAVIQRTAQRFDRGRWQGRLTTALEGRNLLVEGDPILLEHALANVVENALRLSPDDEPVTVRGLCLGDSVRIEVIDRGPGVATDQLHRIFEKFNQGAGHRAEGSGAGLGLSIAKGLVEAMHGAIGAHNRDDARGLTVTLSLRACQ